MRIQLSSYIRIKKCEVSPVTKLFIQKNLTFKNPKYSSAAKFGRGRAERNIPRFISAYHGDDEYVYIARGFLKPLLKYLDRRKIEYTIQDDTVINNADFNLDKISTIRPYQSKATMTAMKSLNGVIKMPCGAGKTITLTNVIRRLKQHTLVIVHTNFIRDQWIKYFKDNYDYEPGVLQGQTENIKPITIAMIPTLYKRELTEDFLNRWGCIVVDETHRVPADSFFNVVNQFPAKYRFGTTATARRNDGLTNMIFATLGEIIYDVKSKTLAKKNYLTIPKVQLVYTDFRTTTNNYHLIIKQLSRNSPRNELILNNLYESRNRFNLVLSNRIEHLESLVDRYSEMSENYELVTGKMKKDDRNEIIQRMIDGELNVIFATQLADEGLDIPNLDTVHLVYPTMADGITEQRIGRIQRYKEVTPIVYDYIDNEVAKLRWYANNRIKLYNDLELEIERSYGV